METRPPSDSPNSTVPSPSKSSFYQTAKRKFSGSSISILPRFLQSSSEKDFTSPPGTPGKAASIAPTSHRENTALHALLDSLPTLPTLTAPSLASLSSLSFPSKIRAPTFFCHSPPTSGLEDDHSASEDSDEEQSSPQPQQASSSQPHRSKDPLKRLSGNVVVLGGYRGSILRDAKTLKRVWIPLRVGFGLRKPDLGLGLDDESEERSRDKIVPGRMLMAVGGVIDLGKKLKDKLKSLEASSSSPALRFHNWGYDWRRRLELSSAELLDYLIQLKEESKERGEGKDGQGEGATVIAHSMGGLVTLHALATALDPTIFKSIIFAGTPFHGCVNALGPMKKGDGVLFNREICSPSVVFSMRSTFYFLPLDGKCFETPSGVELPVDFFDTQSWSDHGFSPLTEDLLVSKNNKTIGEKEQHSKERKDLKEDAKTAEEPNGVEGILEPTLGGGGGESSRVGSRRGSDAEEDPTASEGEVGAPIVVTRRNSAGGEEEVKDKEEVSADAEIEEYLERTLKRAKAFNEALLSLYNPRLTTSYPPIAIITSRKTPTVRGVQLSTETSTIRSAAETYEHLLFGEGDGIVTFQSARTLPGQWNNHLRGVEESGFGHVSLLGDLDTVRKALELVEG